MNTQCILDHRFCFGDIVSAMDRAVAWGNELKGKNLSSDNDHHDGEVFFEVEGIDYGIKVRELGESLWRLDLMPVE